MPDLLYQVWINDDEEINLLGTSATLTSRFPDLLEFRTNMSYGSLKTTISRQIESQEEEKGVIYAPDLVIQDYNFGYNFETAPDECQDSLELIVQHYPTAKIFISTTSEYFNEAEDMLQRNGWDFPVIGKVGADRDARSKVTAFVAEALGNRGYDIPGKNI